MQFDSASVAYDLERKPDEDRDRDTWGAVVQAQEELNWEQE